MAPGARDPPCWIVLESFHKWETSPPRGIERAWLREATADLAEKALGLRLRLELRCNERHS